MEIIKRYLKSQKTAEWKALCNIEQLVWVNWGDSDVQTVTAFSDRLKTADLSAELSQPGSRTTISYRDKPTLIPYVAGHPDLDMTLITLNSLLQPDYDIRLWLDSIGSDTLGFIILPLSDWKALEKKFKQEYVRSHFAIIEAESKMFTMLPREISLMVNQRRKKMP